MGILFAMLILTLVVFLHELGHFLAFKWRGVSVYAFSIGFGPVLWRRRIGETEYRFSLIPAGGYVMPTDENVLGSLDDEELERLEQTHPQLFEEKRWLSRSTPMTRFIGAAAGPAANLVVAFILAFTLSIGSQQLTVSSVPTINEVVAESPAEQAGLKSGDVIAKIGGLSVHSSAEALAWLRHHLEKGAVDLTIRHPDGSEENYSIEGKLFGDGEESKRARIGAILAPDSVITEPTVAQAASFAGAKMMQTVQSNFEFLGMLLSGQFGMMREMSGPVGIVAATSDAMQGGVVRILALLFIINMGLAMINLIFPIPILDGPQMLFALYEGVSNRKVPERLEHALSAAGVVMVGALFLFTIVNDIWRLAS